MHELAITLGHAVLLTVLLESIVDNLLLVLAIWELLVNLTKLKFTIHLVYLAVILMWRSDIISLQSPN